MQDHAWHGFSWIDAENKKQSVAIFLRKTVDPPEFLVVICNFTPVFYDEYRVGVPKPGWYKEVFNSDLGKYGGSDQKNQVSLRAIKNLASSALFPGNEITSFKHSFFKNN